MFIVLSEHIPLDSPYEIQYNIGVQTHTDRNDNMTSFSL